MSNVRSTHAVEYTDAEGDKTDHFSQGVRVDAVWNVAGVNMKNTYPDGTLNAAGDMVLSRAQNTGLLTGTSLGNIASSVSYNAYGETDMESCSSSAGALIDFDYSANNVSRDGLGRILQKSETHDSVTTRYVYTYDDADRLTDVYVYKDDSTHPSEHHAYEYDNGALPVGNGNRTEYAHYVDNDQDGTWDETETVNGTYDIQDRLITYGDATYTYTDGGMLASKTDDGDLTEYSYDLMGSLKTVSLPDGRVIDYMVDGYGRRIWKKEDGVLTKGYIYADALNPVAELNGDGEVESVFVYGSKINVPDYMMKPTDEGWETYRIISDQVGSVRLVIRTSDETVIQELEYDPFGQITQDTSPGFQPFAFAGGLYDPDTGLVRFGARDYDPETGRWTAKDPILFWGGDTNLYGYVMSDPVNFIDPLGLLWSEIAGGIGLGVGFIIGNVPGALLGFTVGGSIGYSLDQYFELDTLLDKLDWAEDEIDEIKENRDKEWEEFMEVCGDE